MSTSEDQSIVWQDPPPDGKRGRMQLFVAALRDNPGRWALYGDASHPSQTTVLKRMGVEATSRKREDGRHDIYARWPES